MEDEQGPLRAQISNLLGIRNRAQERLLTGWLQTTGYPSRLGCYLGVIHPFVQEIEEVKSLSEQARLLLCLPYSSVAPPPNLGI